MSRAFKLMLLLLSVMSDFRRISKMKLKLLWKKNQCIYCRKMTPTHLYNYTTINFCSCIRVCSLKYFRFFLLELDIVIDWLVFNVHQSINYYLFLQKRMLVSQWQCQALIKKNLKYFKEQTLIQLQKFVIVQKQVINL